MSSSALTPCRRNPDNSQVHPPIVDGLILHAVQTIDRLAVELPGLPALSCTGSTM